jgi:transcriptional regulator with XRE-family HTH domain
MEAKMDIATRLQQFREWKQLSQGDVEQRTGLLRCYISRVENGHTVPSIETLEKISKALEVPLYHFFAADDTDGHGELAAKDRREWYSIGIGKSDLRKLRSALARMSPKDRTLLMFTARKMTSCK